MDDRTFDKIIKDKSDAFLDSGHDAHALTDLRKRLSNLPAKKSNWYGGKTAYVVGSMVLFTLINFGIVWYFSEGRHTVLTDEIEQLRGERSQIISLQDELIELRKVQTDTVYVYREVISSANYGSDPQPNISAVPHQGYFKSLSYDQKLSDELRSFLSRNNLLLQEDEGELILVVHNQPVPYVNEYATKNNYRTAGPILPENLPSVNTFEQLNTRKKVEKEKVPNKTLWALEKHNHKGVDFQFGMEAKYHKSIYDIGTGDINGGLGLMTEVIFSPVLRLETGLHFGARSYSLKKDEIANLPAGTLDHYPGLDEDLGQLVRFESDAKLLKIPLNLKVFGILDHNKKWYASVGLTPQWATHQELDYKYSIDIPEPPQGDLEFVSFVGAKQEISTAYYTTTLNLGTGMEVYLNEKLRWQLGVFYQYGLSDAGVENRKLQSFGLKSSLWFNKP